MQKKIILGVALTLKTCYNTYGLHGGEGGYALKYELGGRIRRFRKERGYSQKELAAMIGVSNSRLSNWEKGLNRPDADILAALCVALRISPSELLQVRLGADLTTRERRLISAYREKSDMRSAVDRLLELEGTDED